MVLPTLTDKQNGKSQQATKAIKNSYFTAYSNFLLSLKLQGYLEKFARTCTLLFIA